MDRESNMVAGFNTQKLLQVPEGFGTGCIVQAAEHPRLFEPTIRLLQALHFTGIAEVEYKWNACKSEYELIEIKPRPWDQRRLGKSCGADLVYLAFCDYAGLARPAVRRHSSADKWIAEDAFVETAFRLFWKRDPKLKSLFQLARGNRIYAISSARAPLPFLAYAIVRFIPRLAAAAIRVIRSAVSSRMPCRTCAQGDGPAC